MGHCGSNDNEEEQEDDDDDEKRYDKQNNYKFCELKITEPD